MKDGDPKPIRVFAISEKTPHSWLIAQRNLQDFNTRWQIAGDIVNNARQLEGRVDWGEILRHVSWIQSETKVVRGQMAIRESIALPLASMAANMGWNMHSPEVVYISGFHPLTFLTKRIKLVDRNLARADERKFRLEEEKEETLRREREELGRLSIFRKRLSESLEEYARQNLSENSGYLQVLQRVMYVKSYTRRRIISLLKEGEIESAVVLLQDKK